MENKYYNVNDCEELCAELSEFTDVFKYLMNLPKDNADSKLLTEELLEAFASVAGSAQDMLNSYKYYSEAKLYTAKDEDELLDKTLEYAKKLRNR